MNCSICMCTSGYIICCFVKYIDWPKATSFSNCVDSLLRYVRHTHTQCSCCNIGQATEMRTKRISSIRCVCARTFVTWLIENKVPPQETDTTPAWRFFSVSFSFFSLRLCCLCEAVFCWQIGDPDEPTGSCFSLTLLQQNHVQVFYLSSLPHTANNAKSVLLSALCCCCCCCWTATAEPVPMFRLSKCN